MKDKKSASNAKGQSLPEGVSSLQKAGDVKGMYKVKDADSTQRMPKGHDRA